MAVVDRVCRCPLSCRLARIHVRDAGPVQAVYEETPSRYAVRHTSRGFHEFNIGVTLPVNKPTLTALLLGRQADGGEVDSFRLFRHLSTPDSKSEHPKGDVLRAMTAEYAVSTRSLCAPPID